MVQEGHGSSRVSGEAFAAGVARRLVRAPGWRGRYPVAEANPPDRATGRAPPRARLPVGCRRAAARPRLQPARTQYPGETLEHRPVPDPRTCAPMGPRRWTRTTPHATGAPTEPPRTAVR